MNAKWIFTLISISLLMLLVVGCGIIAPTPTPTRVPPTETPLPPPTRVPPTLPPTLTRLPPTATPSLTPAVPTATPLPPTKSPTPETPVVVVTATRPRPSNPTGTVLFHTKPDAVTVNRIFHVDPNTNAVTPFLDAGGGQMDLTVDDYGTNARLGEVSPDGTKFAYVFAAGLGKVNVLRVVSYPDTTKTAKEIFSDIGVSSPTWSPDGSRIAFIHYNPKKEYFITIVNADGTPIGLESGRRVSAVDIKTDEALAGAQFRGGISWAKTNMLVFAANLGGAPDIYTMFPDLEKTPTIRNLTKNEAEDTTPVWSPDGRLIAFTSFRDGRYQIYLMNADGSGLRRISDGTGSDFSPTWSPDGNWIGFVSNRNNSTDVWMMDLNGGNLKQLVNGDHPAWTR